MTKVYRYQVEVASIWGFETDLYNDLMKDGFDGQRCMEITELLTQNRRNYGAYLKLCNAKPESELAYWRDYSAELDKICRKIEEIVNR